MNEGNMTGWLSCLSIASVELFDPQRASFGHAIYMLSELTDVQDQGRVLFRDCYLETVFGAVFMKALNRLNEQSEDPNILHPALHILPGGAGARFGT
eukprot:2411158-Amphidinium_carterae.1